VARINCGRLISGMPTFGITNTYLFDKFSELQL
jgi:hypothetical protein